MNWENPVGEGLRKEFGKKGNPFAGGRILMVCLSRNHKEYEFQPTAG